MPMKHDVERIVWCGRRGVAQVDSWSCANEHHCRQTCGVRIVFSPYDVEHIEVTGTDCLPWPIAPGRYWLVPFKEKRREGAG